MVERGELRLVRGVSVVAGAAGGVLTVEEAAKVLRIGREAAYDLARQWRVTGGREGLPVVRFGRSLRVPRAALLRLLDVNDSRSNAAGQ